MNDGLTQCVCEREDLSNLLVSDSHAAVFAAVFVKQLAENIQMP
jgi:hypothetical protein